MCARCGCLGFNWKRAGILRGTRACLTRIERERVREAMALLLQGLSLEKGREICFCCVARARHQATESSESSEREREKNMVDRASPVGRGRRVFGPHRTRSISLLPPSTPRTLFISQDFTVQCRINLDSGTSVERVTGNVDNVIHIPYTYTIFSTIFFFLLKKNSSK